MSYDNDELLVLFYEKVCADKQYYYEENNTNSISIEKDNLEYVKKNKGTFCEAFGCVFLVKWLLYHRNNGELVFIICSDGKYYWQKYTTKTICNVM
jgi:hypothetical protein